MKVVVIIPSRYQSSRFMGKPLADVLGKPMIQHVYERVLKSKTASMAAVATDDRRIFEAVEKFGGRAILTSADHPSGTDRIAEAVGKLGLADTDIVVNIQGDEPTIPPSTIEAAVETILNDGGMWANIVTTCEKIKDVQDVLSPDVVKVVTDEDGFALYFSRSPIPLFTNFHRFRSLKNVFISRFAFNCWWISCSQTSFTLNPICSIFFRI